MSGHAKTLRNLLFALFLILPFLVVGSFSTAEIGTWVSTGMCPGGALDQMPAPCGPLTLIMKVFFGGWAAFCFTPLLLVWWTLCTIVWASRRNRGTNEDP
jgi:hypothetical protein